MSAKAQKRGSTARTGHTPPTTPRPKLIRAAATAPSLATSVASRKDCSAPAFQTYGSGASMLLSKVANHHGGCGAYTTTTTQSLETPPRSSPGSVLSSPEDSPDGHGKHPHSAIYFSFPCFEDTHHQYAKEEEKSRQPG